MPANMTDPEIKQAMTLFAKLTGLNLTDERIDRDLPAYKTHLAAIDAIRAVDLPVEAEPASIVALKKP